MIVRKIPLSNGKKLNNLDIIKNQISLPQRLVERYKQIMRNREYFSNSSMTEKTKRNESCNYEDTNQLETDQITQIYISGNSKLKSEIESVQNIKGDKYFLKNHQRTEFGEGEPLEDEEILAIHKE